MTIVILGHRGMGPTSKAYVNQFLPKNVLPENTLIAFQAAIDNGAQGIEFDVYASKDKAVVVSREDILDRNVDGYHNCWDAKEIPVLGRITEKTLVQLRDPQYSLGHDQFIPTLNEVIDLVIANRNKLAGRNFKINVELQGNDLAVADYTWKIIHSYVSTKENNLGLDNFVVNSFNIAQLVKFRQAQQAFPLQFESAKHIELLLGVYTANLFGKDPLLPDWIPAVMAEGRPVLDENGLPMLKTEVDEAQAQRLIDLVKTNGIDYLDIISSDLRINLFEMCNRNDVGISMTCNFIREMAEYQLWGKTLMPGAPSNREIENPYLQKIYILARENPQQTFYYKSDNVQQTLESLRLLDLSFAASQNPHKTKSISFCKSQPATPRVADIEDIYKLFRYNTMF
jgi:glycerophosphoryl diester phosphodiesterase